MHATKKCRRRHILKVDKSNQFPPSLPPGNSSKFSRQFSPFFKKTSRPKSNHMWAHLSNINPIFLLQPFQKPNEFPESSSIRSVFDFNFTFLLQSRKILHRLSIFSPFRYLFWTNFKSSSLFWKISFYIIYRYLSFRCT